MKNCIILGSGRSGTSLAAGLFSECGYYMGNNPIKADSANPKGYFEDIGVNAINEDILRPYAPFRPKGCIGNIFFSSNTVYWQRWLLKLPIKTEIKSNPLMIKRINKILQNSPYCFKDPRFSYTLPVWYPYLNHDTFFLTVFRHPLKTAQSLIKEAQRDSSIRGIKLTFSPKDALVLWDLMYQHILKSYHQFGGSWLFVHYEQFKSHTILQKIENLAGCSLNKDIIDYSQSKTKDLTISSTLEGQIDNTYNRLLSLSGYTK